VRERKRAKQRTDNEDVPLLDAASLVPLEMNVSMRASNTGPARIQTHASIKRFLLENRSRNPPGWISARGEIRGLLSGNAINSSARN